MPSTAARVAVCVLVVLAGCGALQSSPAADDACPPDEDYQQESVPAKPATWDNGSVSEFTKAYDEAYVWNRYVERAETNLSVVKRARVVDRTTNGFVVLVEGSATYSTCSNGQRAVADNFGNVNYFVNETMVVRLEHPENKTANPRTNNGTVVETWED